jgi:diguanylate cyclase (GGDEF)-like protein
VGSYDPFSNAVPGDDHHLNTLCTPMVTQVETLGVIFIHHHHPEQEPRLKQLAHGIADRLTLTLVNLHLRDNLQHLAIRDPLTDLYNRRFMQEALEREFSRASRRNQALALVMMDIDHFKLFNDSYGHAAGDMALKALSKYMVSHTRKEDVVCRFGGEEFVIIMPEMVRSQALGRADELREGMQHVHIMDFGETPLSITLSAGVSSYPQDGESVEEVLAAADRALYRAKAEGRNRVSPAVE